MTKKKESGYKEFYSDFGGWIEKIREKTLSGDFWGEGGAVSCQRLVLNMSWRFEQWCNNESLFSIPAELFSMASSTYYAAGGNAGSRAKVSNLFLKPFWYWRGWRCLHVAEKLSDKFAMLKRMEDMTLGELDVRACVLNMSGRRDEAAGLLSHGIMKILTEQIGTKHDLCLFLIHEAEIIAGMRKYDKENKAEKNYQQAMESLEDEAIPALTKVRVMKSYGNFLVSFGRVYEARSFLNKALFLAEEKGLVDQVVKIRALVDVCI